MMKRNKRTLVLSCLLIACIIISNNIMMVSAAKRTTILTTKIILKNGQKKQIKITNKKKGAKYSFKSEDTTIVTVNRNGVVSAKGTGTVKVALMETLKNTTDKLGDVKVTVEDKKASTTETPATTATSTATPTPTATPTATPTSFQEDANYDVPNDFWNKKSDVTYGEIKNIEYTSTATKSTRKAKVILPAGYTADKKYPVLYLLHGIGGDENSLLNDHVEYVIGNAIASGVAEKMIVVLPNACANATGKPPKDANGQELFFSLEHYKAYDNFINDLKDCLMPYINKNFSTAQGRDNTAISGFSMGGRVSLQIGFTIPDSIRYVGGFCPAPGILEYTNYGVYEKGLFTKSTFTLPSQYMNDTFVLIAAGKKDSIVKDFPLSYHNALQANGVPHLFYVTMGGVNHTGNGEHGGDVYKHGLYNFMKHIFHK